MSGICKAVNDCWWALVLCTDCRGILQVASASQPDAALCICEVLQRHHCAEAQHQSAKQRQAMGANDEQGAHSSSALRSCCRGACLAGTLRRSTTVLLSRNSARSWEILGATRTHTQPLSRSSTLQARCCAVSRIQCMHADICYQTFVQHLGQTGWAALRAARKHTQPLLFLHAAICRLGYQPGRSKRCRGPCQHCEPRSALADDPESCASDAGSSSLQLETRASGPTWPPPQARPCAGPLHTSAAALHVPPRRAEAHTALALHSSRSLALQSRA